MLGWVLGISLVLKLILVLTYGPAYIYHSDDREYLRSAQIWLETGMFTYNDPERPTVFITPAYPGIIALLMKGLGPGIALEQSVRIIQTLLITLSLLLLFRIGQKIVGTPAALWGTCLAALYPPLWLVSNMIFTESLFIFFLLLLIVSALNAMEHPGWRSALIFGLVWAAAVYIRPTIALWPGLVWLWMLRRKRLPFKLLLRYGAVCVLIFCLCLSPWWVRNYEVSGGEFIPLTRSGGNPLLLGTYPYTVPAMFMDEQLSWRSDNNLWEHDRQDTRSALERIEHGFKEQFWLYLSWYTAGKFALFWGDVFYWLPLPGVPLIIPILYHYLLVSLSGYSLFRLRCQDRAQFMLLLFAYMSLLHMIYLAHSRYALPLMPLLCLFAGDTIHRVLIYRENSLTTSVKPPNSAT